MGLFDMADGMQKAQSAFSQLVQLLSALLEQQKQTNALLTEIKESQK